MDRPMTAGEYQHWLITNLSHAQPGEEFMRLRDAYLEHCALLKHLETCLSLTPPEDSNETD